MLSLDKIKKSFVHSMTKLMIFNLIKAIAYVSYFKNIDPYKEYELAVNLKSFMPLPDMMSSKVSIPLAIDRADKGVCYYIRGTNYIYMAFDGTKVFLNLKDFEEDASIFKFALSAQEFLEIAPKKVREDIIYNINLFL
tara:strand:- start:647 stop:1060 length:414 start_codon:yes stop_codon:yes gene_type:complete